MNLQLATWITIAGWTLIHFVWQGAALTLVAAAALRLLRHRSPGTRYSIACLVLAAMLASPVITAYRLGMSARTPAPGTQSAAVQTTAGTNVIWPTGPVETTATPGEDEAQTLRARAEVWLPAIVAAWLAGVAFLLLRMLGGWWRVRRLHAVALATAPSRWQATADRLAARIGLDRARRAFHVVESALVDGPSVVGWLRPAILLPVAALASLTPAQVEAILAHELAHIRRHDYVVNLLQTLAETVIFYHPGVWWISARIRAERELCCDDVAVEACGDAEHYAAALLEMETLRTQGTTLALAVTGGSLIQRVRRILKVPVEDDTRSPLWAVVLAVMLVAGVGARVQRQPSPELPPWQTQATAHFDIYYHAEASARVEQVGRHAERAYQQVTADLRHDLASRVPLVLFETQIQLDRQKNNVPGKTDRLLLALDGPPDRVEGAIVHELTHLFEFDIIPPSSTRVPQWVYEGLADHERGTWTTRHSTELRNMVAAGTIPKLTSFEGSGETLGHAAFEFIEQEYGKEGIRRLLFAFRKNTASAADPYLEAFRLSADEFDSAFERYVRNRFASATPQQAVGTQTAPGTSSGLRGMSSKELIRTIGGPPARMFALVNLRDASGTAVVRDTLTATTGRDRASLPPDGHWTYDDNTLTCVRSVTFVVRNGRIESWTPQDFDEAEMIARLRASIARRGPVSDLIDHVACHLGVSLR